MRYPTTAQILVAAMTSVDLPEAFTRNPHLRGLVDSAIHSPQATFDGIDLVPGLPRKAAVLCRHLCLNHPFPDGNKRMAWLAADIFLHMNDHYLYDDVIRAICVMVDIAEGNATDDEIADAFSRWVRPMVSLAA